VLTDVKTFNKAAMEMETWKLAQETLGLGCFTYSTRMAVIAFQCFIKHTAVIACRIL
jgi:hypothetical protein